MRTELNPMMSSKTQTWETPSNILELVRQVGPIMLDPATSIENPVGAPNIYTSDTNGLIQPWGGHGLVYVNPPYGRGITPKWSMKIAREGIEGAEIIALLPSRTDTLWFQKHVITASVICFWRGRLKFGGAVDVAPFPSVLAYWGPQEKKFRDVFGEKGWIP